MSHKHRPSLLGALIWIGIGILFLLQNFGFGLNFWSLARRYWPVLLILLGAGKILEYFLKKDSVSIRVGEIFGILFLLLFGFVLSRIPFGPFSPVGPFPPNFPNIAWGPPVPPGQWIGESHTYTAEATYPFEYAMPIRIENSNGSVSVSPGSDGEIRVRLKKVVYGSASRTREIADEIHLEGASESGSESSAPSGQEAEAGGGSNGKYFVIRTNRDSLPSDARFNTDMEILVPKNSRIQVRNVIGEVTASDIHGDLDLSTTHRNLEVRDCTGRFTLSNRFADSRLTNLTGNVTLTSRGRVYVEDIKGDVNVTDEYSPVEILGVDGGVKVSSTEGSIRIERITKPVVIEGRGTQIRVADLKDKLKLSASHRSVDISEVASDVAIDSRYCIPLSLKNIEGNIEIESNSDRVNGDDIRGSLTMKARASSLRLNGVAGPLDIRTTLKDVIVNGLEGSCRIVNEYADVSLSAARLAAGDISVKNRNGGIDLFLPGNASFAIDAIARNGSIDTSYSGLPSSRNENNAGVLKARVREGGPMITLETDYGNIQISRTRAQERSSVSIPQNVVAPVVLHRNPVMDRVFSIIGKSGARVRTLPAETALGGMR